MPLYQEQFKEGERVLIAPLSELARFRREWRWHHPLHPKQLQHAGRPATVRSIGFYHGGDVLYWLDEIDGTWHEACLKAAPDGALNDNEASELPPGTAPRDAMEADRMIALVRRIRRNWFLRVGGSAVMIAVAVLMLAGLASFIGRWPVWLIYSSIPVLLVFGLIGEIIGRAVEERSASSAEILFARSLILDSDSQSYRHVNGLLETDPQLTCLWLRRLAMYSADTTVARLATDMLDSHVRSASLR
jgi:hypothetical protein